LNKTPIKLSKITGSQKEESFIKKGYLKNSYLNTSKIIEEEEENPTF